MREPDDNALILQAADGSEAAFERLIERYYMTIYRMAYKWCGAKEDAEDVAQEVCIKLARAIGGFRFESAFSSWLCRMVINTAKDMARGRGRRRAGDEAFAASVELDPPGVTPEDAAQAAEIMAAIRRLPDKLRDAVLLVAGEGLTHAEAAEVLECRENTVSWRIHEARKRLSKLLE